MADEEDLKRATDGELDLSQSDFRGANLSGLDFRGRNLSMVLLGRAIVQDCDFRGCDLSSASVAGMKADRANFSGATLPKIKVAVSMRGANLSEADLSTVRMEGVDFTGADLRGASFKDAHIGKDVVFKDALYDDRTDFVNVTGLRLLGRLDVFKNFEFENGRYKRRDISGTAMAPSDALIEPPVNLAGSSLHSPVQQIHNVKLIASRLSMAPLQAGVMATHLATAITENIERISAKKPNDPEALTFFNEHVEFLKSIADGLRLIAGELGRSQNLSEPEKEAKHFSQAAKIIGGLSDNLEDWLRVNAKKYLSHAADLGMICISSAYFAQYGATPGVAFYTAAALVGGKPLVEAANGYLKKIDAAKS